MINTCMGHSLEKLRVGTQRQEKNKTDKLLKVILKMLDREYSHKLNFFIFTDGMLKQTIIINVIFFETIL